MAVLGVDDLVVIETGEAVLVVPREKSQRVREIVERLEAGGLGLSHIAASPIASAG